MYKVLTIMLMCVGVVACSANKKPPLQPSQVVNGRSIVVPPEFHTIPSRPTSVETPVQPAE